MDETTDPRLRAATEELAAYKAKERARAAKERDAEWEARVKGLVQAEVAPLSDRIKALEAAQVEDDARWTAQTKEVARGGWRRVATLIAILTPLVPVATMILQSLLGKLGITVDPATQEALMEALERVQAQEAAEVAPVEGG